MRLAVMQSMAETFKPKLCVDIKLCWMQKELRSSSHVVVSSLQGARDSLLQAVKVRE